MNECAIKGLMNSYDILENRAEWSGLGLTLHPSSVSSLWHFVMGYAPPGSDHTCYWLWERNSAEVSFIYLQKKCNSSRFPSCLFVPKGQTEEQGTSTHLLSGITQTKSPNTYATTENPRLRAGWIWQTCVGVVSIGLQRFCGLDFLPPCILSVWCLDEAMLVPDMFVSITLDSNCSWGVMKPRCYFSGFPHVTGPKSWDFMTNFIFLKHSIFPKLCYERKQ